MKRIFITLLTLFFAATLSAQTLEEARNMYRAGLYAEALPVFAKHLKKKPKTPNLNHWYGVCLYETGQRAEAEKYLHVAVRGKIPEAYRYLGAICFEQYRFTEAVGHFSKYMESLSDDNENLAHYETLTIQAELGAQMLSKVQRVQVIDSMVLDKDDFFTRYRLSNEVGSLQPYADLVGDEPADASPVFLTQRGDKMLYAVPDGDAGYELVTRVRMSDGSLGEEETLDDLNTLYNENYPFLLTDGITLYYASDEEDVSLGGYDIFKTKYNYATGEYAEPEALPMPFNSPYNDYLMAIDEMNGVGWFASDRYQSEGKVCLYLFLCEKEPRYYAPDDRSPLLYSVARLVEIRDTWQDSATYVAVKEKIYRPRTEPAPVEKKDVMAFVISDDRVYTDVAQFRSKEARNLYVKARDLRKVIAANETELARMRNDYAAGKNVEKAAARIQELEKLLVSLYPQPEEYEMQCRAAELSVIDKR